MHLLACSPHAARMQPRAALREQAKRIPPAVVARLGLPLPELQSLHAALTPVIAAARTAPA